MLKLWILFKFSGTVYMNTLHFKDRISHKIPGSRYFFNVTEEASYLELHLLYTYPKLYKFNGKHLTFSGIHANVRSDATI